jgi:hypothetical protein
MNSRVKKVLLLILMNLALKFIMAKFLDDLRVFMCTVQNFTALLQLVISDSLRIVQVKERRRIWRIERMTMFADVALLHAHLEREFTRRVRVKPLTFDWICKMVAPFLARSRLGSISLQNRVAISLARLGTGNYLTMCGDLYGMSEGTASIVVREFCEVIEKHLKPRLLPRLRSECLPAIARKFEELHGIPMILGAVDCSHIAILAPFHDPFSYYNRKGFHSTHLQVIVDSDALIWDYDWGMAGSCHDFTVFQQSKEGRKIMRGDYGNYKVIGDAAYLCRPWAWVPFKGSAVELPPFKLHWNFCQSSTRMSVERALGILKGRWRILLRKIEMPLENIGCIVAACVCLHNLCIMHKDFVDEDLHHDTIQWLEQCRKSKVGHLLNKGMQKIVDYGVTEVGRCTIDVGEIFDRAQGEQEEVSQHEGAYHDIDDEEGLQVGMHMHLDMAKNLFRAQLERETLMEGDSTDDEGN